jgi:hypothetical protein
MSRRPARFTQADIARAIRAIEQTGARMTVKIAPDGTIWIVPDDNVPQPPTVEPDKKIRL